MRNLFFIERTEKSKNHFIDMFLLDFKKQKTFYRELKKSVHRTYPHLVHFIESQQKALQVTVVTCTVL